MIKYYNIPICEAYNKIIKEEAEIDKDKIKIEIKRGQFWNKFFISYNDNIAGQRSFRIRRASRKDASCYHKDINDAPYVDFSGYYIEPEYRGKGLGQYLFEQMIKYVKDELKMKIIITHVEKNNNKALHIHKKMGFEILKENPDMNFYTLIKKL